MIDKSRKDILNEIIKISIDAGNKIMEIYNSADFGVEMKTDNSPLTLADKASHNIIVEGLKRSFPEIPILSEEGNEIPYNERKEWKKFWLVDPLDGTKEFIKKNGEFTVNIALIEDDKPTMGVIYAPAYFDDDVKNGIESDDFDTMNFQGTLYFGDVKSYAYKQTANKKPIRISVKNCKQVVAVKSRSHSSEDEQNVLNKFNVTDLISVGSSLKFCMVAEGKAQLYYRHGPTNEWDVGAGHAIVEAAGGLVDGLHYNKEIILNGKFLITTNN